MRRSKKMRGTAGAVAQVAGCVVQAAFAVGAAVRGGQTAPLPVETDAVQTAIEVWKGRALIVRGFPAGDDLRYDSAGHAADRERVTDWTLAGFELQTVSRRGNGDVQLEGVRVAIRYNTEQHTFERHLLKEEPMRVSFAAADGRQADAALGAIFSVGIDPALQRSMPNYWSHYFIPALAWPADGMQGKTVMELGAAPAAGAVYPQLEKKAEPGYTAEATRDKVHGAVRVTAVVDAEGVPRHIAVQQPLGYGLDAKTAEAVTKYRFKPGSKDGVPAAMEVVVNQAFE